MDEKKQFLEDFHKVLNINHLCFIFTSKYPQKSLFRAMVEQPRGLWLSNQAPYG